MLGKDDPSRHHESPLKITARARASLPVRFTDCRDAAIHDTTDPDVIVVEYELTGS
jgi:uncharacterized protein